MTIYVLISPSLLPCTVEFSPEIVSNRDCCNDFPEVLPHEEI